MMQAMAAILASAGFAVEGAHDEYRSHQLRVTDGPAQPVPMWTLRDEDTSRPACRAPQVPRSRCHTGFTTSGTPENVLKPR